MHRLRVHTIDGLRGLCAVLVMLYHFWHYAYNSSEPKLLAAFLNFSSIYCVEIFFIISGFSLAYAYNNSDFSKWKDCCNFIIRRYFRIAPLYISLVILMIVCSLLQIIKAPLLISTTNIIANISLLFGFISPSLSLVGGGWSIGLEFVFYFSFPLIMIFTIKHRFFLWLFLTISVIFLIFFAFNLETFPLTSISKKWNFYVNPMNHLAFFISGVVTFFYMGKKVSFLVNKWILLGFTLISIISVNLFYTNHYFYFCGKFERLYFSLFAFILFYNVLYGWGSRIFSSKVFLFLGEISYSIYLLHIVIYSVVKRFTYNPSLQMACSICIVMVIATLSHFFVEKPFIQLGKKLTRKFSFKYMSIPTVTVQR